MTVKPFPFITDGIHGDVPINFYPAADSDKQAILLPCSGLDELCDLPDCTEVRGIYGLDNYLYVVAVRGTDSILWRVDTSGGYSELGTISTSSSGPVWITNNATQICIVDGVSGYVYTPSTGLFVEITDADFPGAGSMDYQDGYGLFTTPDSNQWFFSSLHDFMTFDALDFYTKESKPDKIRGILSFMREPWVFGVESGSEVWYNAGGDNSSASNPTFARNTGGVIPYACGAVGTILPESRSNPRTTLRWLTSQGQYVQASGYSVQIISNKMFDQAVQDMTDYSDAIAFDYKFKGHEFTQITFPSESQTWVYDGTTKLWHKRQSYSDGIGQDRHRANCYTMLDNRHWVGDYSNGKIYEMKDSFYSDNGTDITRQIHSQEVDGGMQSISFPDVQIVVEPGVGLVGADAPQIMLQFSGDYGNTWSNEVWRSAGEIGDYTCRAMWQQMGSGYRRMYRATFTDQVNWRILGISWGGE